MTNDLEDKLDSILYEFDSHNPDVYSAKQQIRQAFIDAGYVQVPLEVQETWREYNRMAGYLTGKEWYKRFMRAIYSSKPQGDLSKDLLWTEDQIEEAVKRASGLE